MNRVYDQRINWKNFPSTDTALNAANLNKMDYALYIIDWRVVELDRGEQRALEYSLDSEAWAVGERDGHPVSSTDETYHNNAKYYSDRAESASLHPPYIGANGNWYVFNTATGQYVDSGVDASITITIGQTSTLSPGSSATVTNSGTSTDPVFNFGIPQGATGATGRGISSIAKTGTSGLVDTYTITYSDGTTSTYTVTNGADGEGSVTSVNNIQPIGGDVTVHLEDCEVGQTAWSEITSILS